MWKWLGRLFGKAKKSGRKCGRAHEVFRIPAVLPTCTKDGLSEGKRCNRCGKTLVPQVYIPAAGHKIVVDQAVEPTCVKPGLTEGKHCTVCGEILVSQERIPPRGHVVSEVEGTAPTCVHEGKTSSSICSVCGAIVSPSHVIPPLGHLPVKLPAISPTKEQVGFTEGLSCGRCGKILALQQIMPILSEEEPDEKTNDSPENVPHTIDDLFQSSILETADIQQQDAESDSSDDPVVSEEEAAETTMESANSGNDYALPNDSAVICAMEKQSRLDELAAPEKAQWPLGRILAFGVTFEEYQALKEHCLPELTPSLGHAVPCLKEHEGNILLNRLDDAEWNATITLCKSIANLRAEHQQGMVIAQHKIMGKQDKDIGLIMGLSSIDVLKKYISYTHAVKNLLSKHLSSFDFMYPHGVFDAEIAKAFFGGPALKRIQYCCDLDKFHRMRSSLQS